MLLSYLLIAVVTVMVYHPCKSISIFSIGSVGKPFPSVKFRIVSEDGRIVLCEGDSENIIQHQERVGALEIKGESVFKGYLNLDNVTKESFNDEGWFLTGVFSCLIFPYFLLFFGIANYVFLL